MSRLRAVSSLAPFLLVGCAALLDIEEPGPAEPGASSSSGGVDASSSGTSSGGDGGAVGSSSSSGSSGSSSSSGSLAAVTYSERKVQLEVLRQQGPSTPTGSTAQCTDTRVVWLESGGQMHSWSGLDQRVVDYGFTVSTPPYAFRASDSYIVTANPSFQGLDVYRTATANEKVTTLPYSPHFGASGAGVNRLERLDSQQMRVSRWTESVDKAFLSASFASQQPWSSIQGGTTVVPQSVSAPYLLNLAFDDGAPSTSLLFDGASALQASLPTPRGLLVWYARNGNNSALRLYRGNLDTGRYEIADELANRDPYFPDAPAQGHHFFVRLAFYAPSWVIYTSIFGIWAYHTETGELRPLQLGPQTEGFAADLLCVMQGAGLLAYRDLRDAAGRIWTVPLGELLAE